MKSIVLIDMFLNKQKYEPIVTNTKLVREMESMIKVAYKSI